MSDKSKKMTVGGYRIRKWAFFVASILSYFVPFIVTAACLIPTTQTSAGVSWAFGIGIVILNAIPFVGGVLRNIFSHIPMINTVAFAYVLLYVFFTAEVFENSVGVMKAIEIVAVCGGIGSSVFWAFYRHYADSLKAAKVFEKMGGLDK